MSSLASEPSSLADVHSVLPSTAERPNTPPDAVVAEVIDENTRLQDQNTQLKTRYPRLV